MSRKLAAHKRWHKHLYVEEANEVVNEVTKVTEVAEVVVVEEAAEVVVVAVEAEVAEGMKDAQELVAEMEGVASEGQVNEVEAGGLDETNNLVEDDRDEDRRQGSSERSKLRAREILNNHLSKLDQFFRVDVVRKLCSKLKARGKNVPGVEVDLKAPTASLCEALKCSYSSKD